MFDVFVHVGFYLIPFNLNFSMDLSGSQSVKFKALLQSTRSDVDSFLGKALALEITWWHHQPSSLLILLVMMMMMIIIIITTTITIITITITIIIIIIIFITPPPLDCIFMSLRNSLHPNIFNHFHLCLIQSFRWIMQLWRSKLIRNSDSMRCHVCLLDWSGHLEFDWRSPSPFIGDFMYALCWNVARMSAAQASMR